MDDLLHRAAVTRAPYNDANSNPGRFGLLPSLLEEFFQPAAGEPRGAAFPFDIEETETAYQLTADLPGLEKGDSASTSGNPDVRPSAGGAATDGPPGRELRAEVSEGLLRGRPDPSKTSVNGAAIDYAEAGPPSQKMGGQPYIAALIPNRPSRYGATVLYTSRSIAPV